MTAKSISGSSHAHLTSAPDLGPSAFEQFPDELFIHLLAFLPAQDIARCARVSRQFYQLANDKHLWKTVCQKAFPHADLSRATFSKESYRKACVFSKNAPQGIFTRERLCPPQGMQVNGITQDGNIAFGYRAQRLNRFILQDVLWDMETNTYRIVPEFTFREIGHMREVAPHRLLVPMLDGSHKILDAQRGNCIFTSNPGKDIQYLNKDQIACFDETSIQVIDLKTKKPLGSFSCSKNSIIQQIATTNKGQYLVASLIDGPHEEMETMKVCVWDVADPENPIFTHDTKPSLLFTTEEGFILYYDPRHTRQITVINSQDAFSIREIKVSPHHIYSFLAPVLKEIGNSQIVFSTSAIDPILIDLHSGSVTPLFESEISHIPMSSISLDPFRNFGLAMAFGFCLVSLREKNDLHRSFALGDSYSTYTFVDSARLIELSPNQEVMRYHFDVSAETALFQLAHTFKKVHLQAEITKNLFDHLTTQHQATICQLQEQKNIGTIFPVYPLGMSPPALDLEKDPKRISQLFLSFQDSSVVKKIQLLQQFIDTVTDDGVKERVQECITELNALNLNTDTPPWCLGGLSMRQFMLFPNTIRHPIYGHMADIIKNATRYDYFGCGEDAFEDKNGMRDCATNLQRAEAIFRYLEEKEFDKAVDLPPIAPVKIEEIFLEEDMIHE